MAAVATRDAPGSVEAAGPQAPQRLPPVALLVFLTACGYLMTVVANALSRATLAPSPMIFWVGVGLVVVPIVFRLTGTEASARERLFLVCMLGLGLYAIKLARDSFTFSYSDELVHAYNAIAIDRTEGLFSRNPILQATPYYPGLEGSTAALMKTGGVSVFSAGVLIVGLARLLIMVSLFVLLERLTLSARVAGIGSAAYTANANFLYFEAQYSYESLALPVIIAVLAAVAFWRQSRLRECALPIVLGTAAAVVTHHLSSIALAAALVALCLIPLAMRSRRTGGDPWHFALLAVLMIGAWTVFVGNAVIDYLAPVFEGAAEGVKTTIQGDTPPRELFKTSKLGPSTSEVPWLERTLSLVAVPVLAVLVGLGLRQVWNRYRFGPFQILLALSAIAYFGTLGLRLTPSAWEVGNRASGFLFVGVGFVVACSRLELWEPRRAPRAGRVLLTGGIALAVVGGVVAGWPAAIRLSQPLIIEAEGNSIESESVGMARWLADALPARRFAAPVGTARWALVEGRATVFAGARPDIQDLLIYPRMSPWMREVLRDNDIRYVISDRRFRGTVAARSPYFAARPPLNPEETLIEPFAEAKFEVDGAVRVFDSGHIVIFDRGPGS